MPILDLDRITGELSPTWSGYLRDWDRALRSGNHPETTRYNYLLAASQLARNVAEHSPDPDADDAADDPAEITKAHIESFQAWMIETRSASTAANKHKALSERGPFGAQRPTASHREPHVGPPGPRMFRASPQVATQRTSGLVPEPHPTGLRSLSAVRNGISAEVQILDRQIATSDSRAPVLQ
ncbi:hypothetical protein GCM10027271_42190 [Saccharopolyspora gloriosae]|uniref:Integrase SAM-like N-terminal domain-containing protein n=1 Tax=Saccharopolyspora gloriosae TaxID=455344 RepID=A0A840NFW9_9PSEU|nr:phage integrase N-terminal SAM-like domain-containing protein [Saccharopolyspora gloriosae]MBB5070484.1 hypothetical protein [Saccharopolyspora gloriosae]